MQKVAGGNLVAWNVRSITQNTVYSYLANRWLQLSVQKINVKVTVKGNSIHCGYVELKQLH